jgi:propanediol utilization protein
LCTISKLHLHNNIEITEKWEKNQHDDILILFEVDDKYMLLDNVVTILTLHVLYI